VKSNRKDTGKRGEDLAAAFLMERGYRILERNWRCPVGEIDIIARDGNELVFVEVKSRTSDLYGTPETSVNARKQKKVASAALYYINEKSHHHRNARFDVVAVTFQEGPPRIELTCNAFELA
jgi:putative endonuclease